MTAPLFSPGHVVAGKYSIRGLMGFSGSAATYAAASPEGRDVALKVFSPLMTDRPEVLAALQRGVAVTAALPAGTSAPILDSGFDPVTRAAYVTTEILTSPSLAHTVFRGGALPVADVVRLLQGMARSVDAAHAQRFVHGALKPQNVFVGPPPERAVRVVDFGVGTAREAVPTGDGQANAAPWLAPEQIRGGPVGPGTDVFSAALVAFFALTGRSFWRSCQGPAPDVAGWHQEVVAPRPPPSMRAKELGAALSPALDVALAKALSPDPSERQRSVAELADAVAAGAAQPTTGPAPFATTAYAPEGLAPPAPVPWSPGAPTPPPATYGQPASAADAAPGQVRSASAVPAPPSSRKGLVIGLAVLGVVALGGTGTAFVLHGRASAEAAAASASASAALASAMASASAAAASVAAAAAGATASAAANEAPGDAGAATAPAAADQGTAAGATGAAEPVADAGADAPSPAELTVVCVPDCDTIAVDDAGVSAPMTDPLPLDAGAHVVVVTKATYLGQTRKVTLKPGQVDKETFFLAHPGPAAPKPCGKFLERCPQ